MHAPDTDEVDRRRSGHALALGYVERSELKQGIRSCPHGAYVIFFTVDDQGVRIERVLHGARDLGPLLNQ
jgi:plasmid stabilization system protein ParE